MKSKERRNNIRIRLHDEENSYIHLVFEGTEIKGKIYDYSRFGLGICVPIIEAMLIKQNTSAPSNLPQTQTPKQIKPRTLRPTTAPNPQTNQTISSQFPIVLNQFLLIFALQLKSVHEFK